MPNTDLLSPDQKTAIKKHYFSLGIVNSVAFYGDHIGVGIKPGAPIPTETHYGEYPVRYFYEEAFTVSSLGYMTPYDNPSMYAVQEMRRSNMLGSNWSSTQYEQLMDYWWRDKAANLRATAELLPEQQGNTTEDVPCRRCFHESIRGGISTGTSRTGGGAGTLGGIMFKASDGTPVLISNYHVWCISGFQAGDRVVQPARYDNAETSRHIGKLWRWGNIIIRTKELDEFPVEENLVDCAASTFLDLTTQKRNRAVIDLGAPTGPGVPTRGMKVAKSGRTTETTYGTITSTDKAIKVNRYPIRTGGTGFAYFDKLIETTPMVTQGDSGSFLFDTATKKVVGLIMGGGPAAPSYACNIAYVRKALGVAVLKPTVTRPNIEVPGVENMEIDPIMAGIAVGGIAGAFIL